MAERPGKPSANLINLLTTSGVNLNLKSAETPDEQASRLRREEAEDAHKRRISLIVHVFVLTMVATALATSVYIVVAKDPKTGLPDKAIGVITAIVAGGVGYVTGKGSK